MSESSYADLKCSHPSASAGGVYCEPKVPIGTDKDRQRRKPSAISVMEELQFLLRSDHVGMGTIRHRKGNSRWHKTHQDVGGSVGTTIK